MGWIRKLVCRGDRSPTDQSLTAHRRHHPLSLALVHGEIFASLVARRRGATVVSLCDALAGIYIASAEFDSLGRYWNEAASFGWVVANACGALDPRLRYWSDLYSRASRLRIGTIHFYKNRSESASPELEEVRRAAEALAVRRAERIGTRVLVIPEDLLLAMATAPESSLADELVNSGLDVARLRNVAEGTERHACPG